MPEPTEHLTKVERVKGWAEQLDTWKKLVAGAVGIVLALVAGLGLMDQGLKWYLKSYATAAEVSKQQQSIDALGHKVDQGQRLQLQDQEIRLGKEIRDLERAEKAGRLSAGEGAYLDILRGQRDAVQRQLRRLPANP